MTIKQAQPKYHLADAMAIQHPLLNRFTAGNGPQSEEFAERIADHVGSTYAIPVCNGTMALYAMYVAAINLDLLHKGQTVAIPDLTYVATMNAALMAGLKVKLVEPNFGPHNVIYKPKYIFELAIPINYGGYPCDGGFFNDDACGFMPDMWASKKIKPTASMISFHAIKQLGIGEGAAIVTDDAEFMDEVGRIISNQQFGDTPVLNLRMSDILCALGNSRMTMAHKDWTDRMQLFDAYEHHLKSTKGVSPLFSTRSGNAMHLFPVVFDSNAMRDKAVMMLIDNDIGTRVHYKPLSTYKIAKEHPDVDTSQLIGHTRELTSKMLSLPFHLNMNENQVDLICKIIKEALDD